MTLDAIKEAIEQLPPEQQTVLARWLSERDWKAWDEQIVRDFSPGGRGMPLLAELSRKLPRAKLARWMKDLLNAANPAREFSVSNAHPVLATCGG